MDWPLGRPNLTEQCGTGCIEYIMYIGHVIDGIEQYVLVRPAGTVVLACIMDYYLLIWYRMSSRQAYHGGTVRCPQEEDSGPPSVVEGLWPGMICCDALARAAYRPVTPTGTRTGTCLVSIVGQGQ